MKRAFIRGLWGKHDSSHRTLNRRFSVDNDIERIRQNPFNEPFKVYVYGKENFDKIKDFGFDCLLLDEHYEKFDLIKYQYRNKMEILKYAMNEDGYDEIVYLDWDCIPQKKLPVDFWSELGKKERFQACLQLYHRRKCLWRSECVRQVPNGGMIYLRDKSLINMAIDLWNTMPQDNDEPAFAKMSDNLYGGWRGSEFYWNTFELMFCNLHKASAFPIEKLALKNECFKHFQG